MKKPHHQILPFQVIMSMEYFLWVAQFSLHVYLIDVVDAAFVLNYFFKMYFLILFNDNDVFTDEK